MTAYGRAHVATPEGNFLIELHSVNRKNLDLSAYLPREILFMEMDFRKIIAKSVTRGQVSLKVSKDRKHEGESHALPTFDSLQKVHKHFLEIEEKLGLKSSMTLDFLVEQASKQKDISTTSDDELKSIFKTGLDAALSDFKKMKETEGENLKQDILPRVAALKGFVEQVNKSTHKAPERQKEKLELILSEFTLPDDEMRLSREIVLFADRVDVTEEITRLNSHFALLESTLEGEVIGKRLDFIIQEMLRETNTIASKCQELEITNLTLSMKSEIEKIREQVQNIE